MPQAQKTTDGAAGAVSGTFSVINPATEEEAGRAPANDEAHLDEAVAGARRAFATWRRDEGARRAALRGAAELLEANASDIARTLTLEQGKPRAHATAEVFGSAAQLKSVAEMPLPHEVTRDDARGRIEICFRPFGVVAAITPWNYPILIATSKLAPALLAGNTVVLKPSPFTPLSTLELGQVLNRVLPAGVLNIVSGGNELGAKLTAHPDVQKISFTGSVPTGKRVGQAAAADLKRVTLELGGNDPAIVLDDANPEAIALSLFWSAFTNAGQICTAIKRVYAPESLLEPLVSALASIARAVKVGDGLDPETELGPINNLPQLERVAALVEDARMRGARMRAGGNRIARKGYFFEPTIVTGIDDGAPLVAEEQFGPVLPVLPYRNLDDALERANATHYGLGASVWSPDSKRARAVAAELDAGTVWINQHLALTALAPFAGAKSSGIGEAGGRWGLASFLQKHVVNERLA
jgi:acyl-CoA reductase-like NAD-dependent aldehyde dehydrogenase